MEPESLGLESSDNAVLPDVECDAPGAVSFSECSEQSCAAELSLDCACLEGAVRAPNALVIGVISPETFGSFSGETRRIAFSGRWLDSLRLALAEWNQELPSERLPASRRPLALLRCNSNAVLARARRAMSHLVERVQSPVVITAADDDTRAVRPRSQATNTPLICSMCYSEPAASNEASLTWPIAPPLVDQAPLAAWRAAELAQAANPPSADGVRTILHLSQSYPGIDEFVAEVRRRLELAGNFHQLEVQTPDPREQRVVQLSVAQAVIEARPQVIVVGMDSDFTSYYLREIERGWPDAVARPMYVLSYMNQELGSLRESVADDDDLRARISGTGWALDSRVNSNLGGLAQRFERRFQQPLDQAQFGYDAFYTAAYALAWADARAQLDGAGVARALEHSSSGASIDLGPAQLGEALARLLGGDDLDLTGTTSRLDWEPGTHATRSDVGLWCLGREPDGELSLVSAGSPIWRAQSGEISGSYSCL